MTYHCKLHPKHPSTQTTVPADIYLTITGFKHYYGLQPFRIGQLIRCRKEPENVYDDEAICCSLPMLGTVGYVANSPSTTAGGTMSAGRLYDRVPKRFYVRVCFTSFTKIICKLEFGTLAELDRRMKEQIERADN